MKYLDKFSSACIVLSFLCASFMFVIFGLKIAIPGFEAPLLFNGAAGFGIITVVFGIIACFVLDPERSKKL